MTRARLTGANGFDWHRDAGIGVHPAGADDLYLVQAFSKGLMPVLQNLADPDSCTPSG